MSRTVNKHTRLYIDGYDMSGFGRELGQTGIEYGEHDLTTWTDTVIGYLRGHPGVNIESYNSVFDDVADGAHDILSQDTSHRTVLAAFGMNGAPVQGDPAFGAILTQKSYQGVLSGAVLSSITFSGAHASQIALGYAGGWGQLLHPAAARGGVNAADGFDCNEADESTDGGLFVYQVLDGDGTATLSVQDAAAIGGAYAALVGATSGVIDCAVPRAAIIAIGRTATVRRFLRWQIVLGTATTVTFASAFIRG